MDITSSSEEIYFNEDPPDLQEELNAILKLDFERAVELAKKRNQFNDDEALSEQMHYEEQAQLLSQQNYDYYNEEVTNIRNEFLERAEKIKISWQKQCKKLVVRQRLEVEQFEQKWRKTRKMAMKRINTCSQVSLNTAKILAMCEKYDQAIDVRDSAQNNQITENTAEIKNIDKEFATRYENMIKRHFHEFLLLHHNLKSFLKSLKERAEGKKKNAEMNLQVEEARNSVMIIQTISKEGFNPTVKEKVIQSFSPRNKKRVNINISSVTSRSSATSRSSQRTNYSYFSNSSLSSSSAAQKFKK